jgi:hypothetical protein
MTKKKKKDRPPLGPAFGPYPGSERFSDWDITNIIPLRRDQIVVLPDPPVYPDEDDEPGGRRE